jgi:hypothetical protein
MSTTVRGQTSRVEHAKPSGRVSRKSTMIKFGAAQQYLAGRERDRLRTEIGDASYAAGSGEMQH